jgi:hypothetical protein
MSEYNKAIVGRWLDEFWNKGNVAIVDELGAPTVLLSLDRRAARPRQFEADDPPASQGVS